MNSSSIERIQVGESRDVALRLLKRDGVLVIDGLLAARMIADLVSDLYRVQGRIAHELGEKRLADSGEVGVIRAPAAYSTPFLSLLCHASLLQIAEGVVGDFCIAHLQNGFVLPTEEAQIRPSDTAFQGMWHRDFPRVVGEQTLSVNFFIPLTPFTENSGATQFLVRSHQSHDSLEMHLRNGAIADAIANPGDVVIFDSTVWHRAGRNTSGHDRLAVNQQYTFPWLKQQIDLCRLMGIDTVAQLPNLEKRILGFHSRPPASLDEFYATPNSRTYRAGQG